MSSLLLPSGYWEIQQEEQEDSWLQGVAGNSLELTSMRHHHLRKIKTDHTPA